MYRSVLRMIALAGPLLAALLLATPALAHEHRDVGPYQFTVGWKQEPSYSDSLNAVQLYVKDAGGNPVAGVCNGLKVVVSTGGQKTEPLTLKPVWNSPTECNTSVLPTRPGTYTFRFQGQIGDTAVDQSFTSSDKTFNSIQNSSAIQFPAQDPTRGEIAQRLDKLDLRYQAQLQQVNQRAERDHNLAIAGLSVAVLAVLALVVVVVLELWRRRRRALS